LTLADIRAMVKNAYKSLTTMLQKIRLLIVASLLLYPILVFSQNNHPEPYKDTEAYQVYSAILPPDWLVDTARVKSLVIQTETENRLPMCLEPDADSQKIIGSAITDYLEVNKKVWLLQENIKLELPYKIVSNEAIESALKKNIWEQLYSDSGRSYITLSAVGFNADKTVAIVNSSYDCGLLCGGGSYHVLQRKDGKWIPLNWKGRMCAWQS
jgi:hypothetical protein